MTGQIQTTRLDNSNLKPKIKNDGENRNTKRLDSEIDDLLLKLNDLIPGDINNETNSKRAIHKAEDTKKTESKNISPFSKESLNFFEKFLHDNWGTRVWFALGNEIAESSKHLLGNLLPKPISSLIYKVLWSLAIIATGSRVGTNAVKAKEGEKFKAGAKMMVHDGIAAIGVPTIVANLMNTVQHKVYDTLKFPTFIRDLLTTIGSLWSCKVVIHKLDPHAAKLGSKVTNLKEDRHKEINDALGRGH